MKITTIRNMLFSLILSVFIINSCVCFEKLEKLEKVEIKSNQNGKYISKIKLNSYRTFNW